MILVTKNGHIDVGDGVGIGHPAYAVILSPRDFSQGAEFIIEAALSRLVRVQENPVLLSEQPKSLHCSQRQQTDNVVPQQLDSILRLRIPSKYIPQLLEWLHTQVDNFQVQVALVA